MMNPIIALKMTEVDAAVPVQVVAVLPSVAVIPVAQAVQVPAVAEGVMKLARQFVQAVAEVQVLHPAPQAVQEVAVLASAAKVEAAQAVQVPAVAEGVMKLARQFVQAVREVQVLHPAPQPQEVAVLSAAEKVLAPQAVQVPRVPDGVW
jgi:hypothetical protein